MSEKSLFPGIYLNFDPIEIKTFYSSEEKYSYGQKDNISAIIYSIFLFSYQKKIYSMN